LSPTPGSGPITTPFGFDSTAADVVAEIDLGGSRAVVTGGASGIGIETARALALAGAEVTLAVRDPAAGREVADDITATTGNGAVRVAALDLVDRRSIAAFVAGWKGPLEILVNNAGLWSQQLQLTAAGREIQFATHHLGHFELALGLHGALAAAEGARIVSVSSRGHLRCPVVFEDLDFCFRIYDVFQAYGQSKTANILFAVEASRRWRADGITANALNPGEIRTRMWRHVDTGYMTRARSKNRVEVKPKTAEQGAATSVLLAASPLLEGVGGRYFDDCNQAETVTRRSESLQGVAPYALDPVLAARLWDVSLELLG
jgi:NAD(P)-dependent dehydrogenase (short-subunit alcohol dehydrogenase family)